MRAVIAACLLAVAAQAATTEDVHADARAHRRDRPGAGGSGYTELVGIPLRFQSEDFGWAPLATGNSDLGLERVDPGDAEGRAHRTLAARGVELVEPPELPPWGGVLALP